MMNVALELQPCCGNRSGIGTYTYELARRLRDGDGLAFSGNVFRFLNRGQQAAALREMTFPIHTQASMSYGIYRRIWHMLPIPYTMLFPKADLNIFFDYIVPPRVSGRIMTTIHDMTYLRFPETMGRRNLDRIRSDIDSSVERSDRILTVSEFSKREIVELLGIAPEKVHVVYNAPSISSEMVPLDSLQKKYGISAPYLLYVGTIEPRKNVLRLLHAFAQLKEEAGIPHQLVLAGGMGWRTEEFQRAVSASRWKDQIILTGYVSGAEKNALYRYADAFVFPSLYEGFGIPPLEAMSFGCPVVCSDAASLPEVVGEAGVYVKPEDVSSIAQGIWSVIYSPEHRETLAEKGREQIQKFSWEQSAKELTGICREVLSI